MKRILAYTCLVTQRLAASDVILNNTFKQHTQSGNLCMYVYITNCFVYLDYNIQSFNDNQFNVLRCYKTEFIC